MLENASQPDANAVSTMDERRHLEEEMLAAFARTPKVPRSPPRGVVRVAPSAVVEMPAVSLNDKLSAAAAAATGEDSSQARASGQQQTKRNSSGGAGVYEMSAEEPRKPTFAPKLKPQGLPNDGNQDFRPETPPNAARPFSCAELSAELVFGRSTKLARTPPKSRGGDACAIAGPGERPPDCTPGVVVGAKRRAEFGEVNQHPSSNLESNVVDGTSASMRDAGGIICDNREENRLLYKPSVAADHGEKQQQQLRPPPVAHTAAAPANREGGRSEQQANAFVGASSPWRYASPSASVDSSVIATVANVRSVVGSAATGDVLGGGGGGGGPGRGGGFWGALTPAAFKGLASGMRTPSTGMHRLDALVNEVRG